MGCGEFTGCLFLGQKSNLPDFDNCIFLMLLSLSLCVRITYICDRVMYWDNKLVTGRDMLWRGFPDTFLLGHIFFVYSTYYLVLSYVIFYLKYWHVLLFYDK